MAAADLLADSEPVLKDWTIKRNCSVSPRQFVGFYVSLVLFSLVIAFMPVMYGVWLVLPFTGIELLAVGVAFVFYARHAVDYERIRLFPNRLLIEQVSAEQLTRFEFNPHWVRGRTGRNAARPDQAGFARADNHGRAAPCAVSARAACRRVAHVDQALWQRALIFRPAQGSVGGGAGRSSGSMI